MKEGSLLNWRNSENTWKVTLVVYFFALIVISVYFLLYIWNPVENSLHRLKTENTTTTSPNRTEIITTITNDTATKKLIIIETKSKEDNSIKRSENVSVMPITGRWFNTDPDSLFTNREIRLLLLTSIFAILGSSAHGIASVTTWIGQNKLERSWAAWYFVRPPIAVAIAIIIYLAFRAGFVTGGTASVSDFGVAAIGSLVGLLTDEATTKLRDIFDTLFGIGKSEEDKGDVPVKGPKITLDSDKTELKVGDSMNLNVRVLMSDRKPAANVKVHLSILKNNVVEFMDVTYSESENEIEIEVDTKGNGTIKIKGISAGETPITATTIVEEVIKGKVQTTSIADIYIIRVQAY